jgi:predicted aspartyl protease
MPVEVVPGVTVQGLEVIGEGMGINREASVKYKIVAHFIKGRISLSSMEIILMILGKLEHFESLAKLARRRRDSEAGENQISMVSAPTAVWRICINNTHRSKTLHLLVEINNYVDEGFVDTRVPMLVMAAVVIQELGIMHLLTSSKTYKTASGVVTQAMGWIDKVPVKVGDVQCNMIFMVVDMDSYDILLGLDFLIKIGAIVDVD